MTIKQVKEFLILCEYRNYTKAAGALFLTPSTLSRHISALEESIGTLLVVRSSSVFQLTDAGQILFEKGIALVNSYDQLMRQLSKSSSGKEKSLMVCSEPFNNDILFETYRRFQETYKNVEFCFHLAPLIPDENARHLEDSDIIITAAEYLESPLSNYHVIPVYTDSVCTILSKNNPIYNKDTFSLSDLKDCPLLMLKRKYLYPPTFHRLETEIPNFRQLHENARRLEPNELYYVLRSGFGWTVFPSTLATEFAHDCPIIPLAKGEGAEIHIIMAWNLENRNPNIKAFERILTSVLKKRGVSG